MGTAAPRSAASTAIRVGGHTWLYSRGEDRDFHP
jgi:hypothetical protein